MKATTAPWRPSPMILLATLLAVAAAIRVALALTTPGWFAEIYILRVVALPLFEQLQLAAADIHPPLQFLLRWAWSLPFGTGVVAHKLFSIAFAIGAAVLTFALVRRAAGTRAALVTVALLTVNAAHVQYSQEIEEYSIEWLLVAGMMLAGWRWIEGRARRDALLYVGSAALAAVNHYESLVVLAIVALSGAAVLAREPRAALAWLAWNAAALALFVPFVPTLLEQLARESGGRFFAFPSPGAIAGLWRVMGFGSRFALFPMLALSALPFFRRETRRFAAFVAPLVVLAPLATRFWVVILPREVLFVLPLWLALVSTGLVSLRPAALPPFVLAILLALGLRTLWPLPRYAEILATQAAERALAPRLSPGALLLHAEPHSLLYFTERHPEYRNRLLMPAGTHLPFFEGGLAIPESLNLDYGAWRRARAAGVPWWGVRVDRALATRGQVWRAGEAAAESLAAAGDTLWTSERVTVWGSRRGR